MKRKAKLFVVKYASERVHGSAKRARVSMERTPERRYDPVSVERSLERRYDPVSVGRAPERRYDPVSVERAPFRGYLRRVHHPIYHILVQSRDSF